MMPQAWHYYATRQCRMRVGGLRSALIKQFPGLLAYRPGSEHERDDDLKGGLLPDDLPLLGQSVILRAPQSLGCLSVVVQRADAEVRAQYLTLEHAAKPGIEIIKFAVE